MAKKIVFYITLFIFLVSMVYLCPCTAALASEGINLASPHDCCSRMPICPLEKYQANRANSFLPTPSSRIELDAFQISFPSFIWSNDSGLSQGSATENQSFPSVEFVFQSYPPHKLFIEHCTLLI